MLVATYGRRKSLLFSHQKTNLLVYRCIFIVELNSNMSVNFWWFSSRFQRIRMQFIRKIPVSSSWEKSYSQSFWIFDCQISGVMNWKIEPSIFRNSSNKLNNGQWWFYIFLNSFIGIFVFTKICHLGKYRQKLSGRSQLKSPI